MPRMWIEMNYKKIRDKINYPKQGKKINFTRRDFTEMRITNNIKAFNQPVAMK